MTVLQDKRGIPATITKSCFLLTSDFSSHESEEMGLGSQSGGERVEMGSPWLAFALCRQRSVHSVLDRTGSMAFGRELLFLFLGHLEKAEGPRVLYRQPSSHGDGVCFPSPSPAGAVTLLGMFDHTENHFSLFFCDLDDFVCVQI